MACVQVVIRAVIQPKNFFPSITRKSKTEAYDARTQEKEEGQKEKKKERETRTRQKLICPCIILLYALYPLILQITAQHGIVITILQRNLFVQ